MEHINMIEIAGTSIDAKPTQFTALLAKKTAPVFEAEKGAESRIFSEVVAVAYRDVTGKPVHGGLFGFSAEGVTSLALKDLEGQVDTSKDPAHVALGMCMMRGPLVFRQAGADQEMDLSIVDMQADKLDKPTSGSTPGREAVKAAYLAEVLPHASIG